VPEAIVMLLPPDRETVPDVYVVSEFWMPEMAVSAVWADVLGPEIVILDAPVLRVMLFPP
jgi:hypothetical protein